MKRPATHRYNEMRQQVTAQGRKVTEALEQQRQLEVERDRAEQALRSVTQELAQARARLKFVEAELASLRPGRIDDS